MGNISDQNSRPKLFYLSYSFPNNLLKKKELKKPPNTSALSINSMPALQNLLGYVLKVG